MAACASFGAVLTTGFTPATAFEAVVAAIAALTAAMAATAAAEAAAAESSAWARAGRASGATGRLEAAVFSGGWWLSAAASRIGSSA